MITLISTLLQETEARLVTSRNENEQSIVFVCMRVCVERAHVHICTHVCGGLTDPSLGTLYRLLFSVLRQGLSLACNIPPEQTRVAGGKPEGPAAPCPAYATTPQILTQLPGSESSPRAHKTSTLVRHQAPNEASLSRITTTRMF